MAGGGTIEYWRSQDQAAFVVATHEDLKPGYLAVVAKAGEWEALRTGQAPPGAVQLDPEVVEPWIFFSVAELAHERGGETSEAEVEAERAKRRQDCYAACRRAGLKLPQDESEDIYFFEAGSVTLKIDRLLRPDPRVKPGAKVKLTWNRLVRRGCPPFTPYGEGPLLYQLVFDKSGENVVFFDAAEVVALPALEAKLAQ
jgi:hypothetical protein